jgi:hypothetical protein
MYKTILLILILLTVSITPYAQNPYTEWENGPSKDPAFFPIGVWLQNPNNAPKFQAAGINLYLGLWQGPTAEQMHILQKHNMPVIAHQNTFGLSNLDSPGILGWHLQDEPDNAQPITDPDTGKRTYGPPVPPATMQEIYRQAKEKDPTRPVLLNLGQGVANDEWVGRGPDASLDDYWEYVKACDIVSFDVYPVADTRKENGEDYLWYVAKGIERLKKWTHGEKIIWNIIECTHINNPDRIATPHQVNAEVWMSIIHGSQGIVYFVHEFQPAFKEAALLDNPEMLAAVTATNHRIQKLAPVLNTPTLATPINIDSSNPDTHIASMLKQYQNKTYLFTVNMRNTATTATLRLGPLTPHNEISEITIPKTLKKTDNVFREDYAPYDVRIFVLDHRSATPQNAAR